MENQWFYVRNNQRIGPIRESEFIDLIRSGRLEKDDPVWTKGFENWKKLFEVSEFDKYFETQADEDFDWGSISMDDKTFFIMTGKDRNGKETLYGPYSLNTLVRLYQEKRVNGRSYIWATGMKNWQILADIDIFETVFSEKPPPIDEMERRIHPRRPFIARMLFHDNNELFEGICRDVSMGGMQILVPDYPAKPGAKISFNVHPDNSDFHFVASGEVVRVLDGGQGFSFRFTELSPDAKGAIEKFISTDS